MHKKTTVLILALAATVAGCSGKTESTSAPASEKSVATVDVRSADLQSKWWTWASVPEGVNPVVDRTGAHCAEQQPVGVWLVAGTFGGVVHRTCTIPAGRPIAGPVLNVIGNDEADCTGFTDGAQGSVKLDGSAVEIVKIEPVPFEFVAKTGNPSGIESGRIKGLGCGLWFSTAPLKPGTHTLVISGKNDTFSVEATYNLTVKEAADL